MNFSRSGQQHQHQSTSKVTVNRRYSAKQSENSDNPPTPNPHPARGVYGFVFYLAAWTLLIGYLIWALVPDWLLKALHITFLPTKYWAVVLPSFLFFFIFLYVLVNFFYNLIGFSKLFDESEAHQHLENDFLDYMSLTRAFLLQIRAKCLFCSQTVLCRYRFSSLAPDPQSRTSLTREIQRRFELLRKQKNSKRITSKTDLIEQVESIAAQRFITSNIQQFSALEKMAANAMQKEHHQKKKASKKSAANSALFPYSSESNPDIFKGEVRNKNALNGGNETTHELIEESENGYFVTEDTFRDEYVVGTTSDLPEEEMTEPLVKYFGELETAAEHIAFQQPGQGTFPKQKSKVPPKTGGEIDENVGDWMSNYGSAEAAELADDAKMVLENAQCASCGANFHCHNQSLPGFVPLEIFSKIRHNANKPAFYQRTDYACRRCHLLKEYNFLLNLNVADVDYAKLMGHLKLQQEVLVMLILDMTNLECSIHRELPKIIGTNKPMIVVGNKIDLLPPDTRAGYLRHYRECLKEIVHRAGFTHEFNILKFLLVSAKTGFGVEDLVTNIHQKWISPRGALRNDIYMVGTTNAGKSTLFNALIQSDLCKVRAMDLVERVATSIWPGTTLSLLKFPIMNLSIQQLELRRRRLLSMQAWRKKEEQVRRSLFQQTRDPRYATLHGIIDSTFKEAEEEKQPISTEETIKYFNGEADLTKEVEEGAEEKRKPHMTLNDRTFQRGHWCYDTPGSVCREQVLDLFTLEELINVVPGSLILPRIFIIAPGSSLLIGGIARLDVLDAHIAKWDRSPIYLTVFASDKLKLFVMPTNHVDNFLRRHRGDATLGAPIGDKARMERFPMLEHAEFKVHNDAEERNKGFADVVFSSIGWASLTSDAKYVEIRAWTPGGRGLHIRQPPMLPYSAYYRGQRIAGSSEYRTRPLSDIDTMIALSRKRKLSAHRRRMRTNVAVSGDGELASQYANFDLV